MRNEGGGFAANIYEAMPESRIQATSYQSLCAPNPQLPVTRPCFQTSNGMKKSGKMRLKQAINESTLSTADAVPLPRWGRLRYESNAIPEIKPSPRGEGGERSEPDRVLAV